MLRVVLVCAGGALGSGARYLVATWAARVLGAGFPYGTLAVNVSGSFLIGVLLAASAGRGSTDELRLFLGPGVLGGFTTYSSFNAETLALAAAGRPAAAALNAGGTLALCLVAGVLGLGAGRVLAGRG